MLNTALVEKNLMCLVLLPVMPAPPSLPPLPTLAPAVAPSLLAPAPPAAGGVASLLPATQTGQVKTHKKFTSQIRERSAARRGLRWRERSSARQRLEDCRCTCSCSLHSCPDCSGDSWPCRGPGCPCAARPSGSGGPRRPWGETPRPPGPGLGLGRPSHPATPHLFTPLS